MIDMRPTEADSEFYITNLEKNKDKLYIFTADGAITETPYSAHNENVYRLRMIEQIKDYLPTCYNEYGWEAIKLFIKKYLAIITDIAGIYITWNIAPNIILKLILTIVIILSGIAYQFFNKINIFLIGSILEELEANKYYLDHLKDFTYEIETGLDGYLVAPEEIGKYHLKRKFLEELRNKIQEQIENGEEKEKMKIKYRVPNEEL